MSLFLSADGLRQVLRLPSAWVLIAVNLGMIAGVVLVVMKTMADLVLHESERRKLGVKAI